MGADWRTHFLLSELIQLQQKTGAFESTGFIIFGNDSLQI
jgi:hypothetical protein